MKYYLDTFGRKMFEQLCALICGLTMNYCKWLQSFVV